MEFITKSAGETKKLGKEIADQLISPKPEDSGRIIALSGDLGSGKTTLVQGLSQGLGLKSRILSPTFILMRRYELAKGHFFHVDLYRLNNQVAEEVVNIGLTDIWQESNNVVIIEWAEKIKDIIPKNTKWIFFENLGGDKRKITIK